jgi:hypothetical protein
VLFCLPIPNGKNVCDHMREQELPRVRFAFEHKARKSDTIEIQGRLRSDTRSGIAEFARAKPKASSQAKLD